MSLLKLVFTLAFVEETVLANFHEMQKAYFHNQEVIKSLQVRTFTECFMKCDVIEGCAYIGFPKDPFQHTINECILLRKRKKWKKKEKGGNKDVIALYAVFQCEDEVWKYKQHAQKVKSCKKKSPKKTNESKVSCPEVNIDYFGNDIRQGFDVGIWTNCSDYCREDSRCKAWTMKGDGKCWLKTSDGGRRSQQTSVSGLRSCTASEEKGAYVVDATWDSKVLYCWSKCGKKGGSCPRVCGPNGYCCRRGVKDCPEDLQAVAPAAGHKCVRYIAT